MDKAIADMIKHYERTNRPVDAEFVLFVAKLCLKKAGLKNNVNLYCLDRCKRGINAMYIEDNNSIYFGIKTMAKTSDNYKYMFPKTENSKYFDYMYATHLIMHEVVHAYQSKAANKEIDIDKDDIATMIVKDEYAPVKRLASKNSLIRTLGNQRLNMIDNKYYIFCPSERLAELDSWGYVKHLAATLDDEKMIDFSEMMELNNCIRGYVFGLFNIILRTRMISDTPTLVYLSRTNSLHHYEEIFEESKNLSEEDRMICGLDVRDEVINDYDNRARTLTSTLM